MLNLPNVSLLGLSQESQFFGAGFNYTNNKTLTINGYVIDLINSFGITGIWTGEQGINRIIADNPSFEGIVLNGVNFGSGRFQDITFDIGNDVRVKNYTATVLLAETGNLFNFTGTYYSGINTNNWQYLQSFEENYDFNKKQNGGYSYSHSASIQFNSGIGQLNAIDAAKNLAKSIFTGSALGFAFYSGYTNKRGKRFISESYNLIDNSCSFDESFDFDSDSGSYSVTRTNSFELGDNGIINVSENGTIRGIYRPTFDSAASAINIELDSAYPRCSGVFSTYAPANAFPLINSPTVQSRNFDIFNNNLGYSISFSNDITNSGSYFWDYSQQVTYSEGIARMTEEGSLIGRGENKTLAYNNAKTGFNLVKNTAANRATQFYSDNVGAPTTNFLEAQTVTHSPFRGTVDYSFNFSNEEVIVGTDGIKRIDVQIEENKPVYLYTEFNIINYKEIIQAQNNGTAGNRTITLNLQGERGVALSTYLDNAKTQVNNNIPLETDPFVLDASYSFNPNENNTQLNLTWNYNKLVGRTISVYG